jgi:hypothetical protein
MERRKLVKRKNMNKEFKHRNYKIVLKTNKRKIDMQVNFPVGEEKKLKNFVKNMDNSKLMKQAWDLLKQWEQLCDEITVKHLELSAVDSMLKKKFFIVPELSYTSDVVEWKKRERNAQADKKK